MRTRQAKLLCLIPLDLDGYVHSTDYASGKRRQITSRLIADFTTWQTNEELFQRQLRRITRALTLDNVGRPPAPKSRL